MINLKVDKLVLPSTYGPGGAAASAEAVDRERQANAVSRRLLRQAEAGTHAHRPLDQARGAVDE